MFAVWPKLAPEIAINEAVGALYTLSATFIGGYLAFRLGWRQLRNARAIDRRLERTEGLVETTNDYATSLGLVVTLCEAPAERRGQGGAEVIRRVLQAANTAGTTLESLLSRAELYGTHEERLIARRLPLAVMRAGVVTSTYYINTVPSDEDLDSLRATVSAGAPSDVDRRSSGGNGLPAK